MINMKIQYQWIFISKALSTILGDAVKYDGTQNQCIHDRYSNKALGTIHRVCNSLGVVVR